MPPKKKQKAVTHGRPGSRWVMFREVKLLAVLNEYTYTSRLVTALQTQVDPDAQVYTVEDVKLDLLPREGIFTHILVELEWTEALACRISALTKENADCHVLRYAWLDETLRQCSPRRPEGLAIENYLWGPPTEKVKPVLKESMDSDDEIMHDDLTAPILPEFACEMRCVKTENRNERITSYLQELLSWWEMGTETDAERQDYYRKAIGLARVLAILRAWPHEIKPENWNFQSRLLRNQPKINAKSTSIYGGYIALLDDIVHDRPPRRPDSVENWSQDPKRVAIRSIRKLKLGFRLSEILHLYHQYQVKDANDLYTRREEIAKTWTQKKMYALEYAPLGPNAQPIDEAESLSIIQACQEAAEAHSLFSIPVGSIRRGHYGGHDIDILFTMPSHIYAQRLTEDSIVAAQHNSSIPSPEQELSKLVNDLSSLKKVIDYLHTVKGIDLVEITGLGHGKVHRDAKSAHRLNERLHIRHIVVRAPQYTAWRHIDLVLAPPSTYPSALFGWSGSRTFLRTFRERTKVLHQLGIERDAISGWNLDPAGNRILPMIYNRVLNHQAGEHWESSQAGIFISTGTHTTGTTTKVYEEDPANFKTERCIFDFFHIEFRSPEERNC